MGVRGVWLLLGPGLVAIVACAAYAVFTMARGRKVEPGAAWGAGSLIAVVLLGTVLVTLGVNAMYRPVYPRAEAKTPAKR